MQLLIFIVLIIGAGFAKAFLDHSAENGFKNPWQNKSAEWRNKWKLDKDGNLIEQQPGQAKYLWLFTPQWKERFYLSSTLLSFLTDGWHLYQFICFNCIHAAIAFLGYPNFGKMIMLFVVSKMVLGISFTCVRRFVLKRKT